MSSFSNSRKICIRRFSSIASQRRSQARKRLANFLGGAYKCQKLIKRGSIIFVFSPTVHPKGSLQFCELWSTAYGCGLERDFLCNFLLLTFLLSGFFYQTNPLTICLRRMLLLTFFVGFRKTVQSYSFPSEWLCAFCALLFMEAKILRISHAET